MKKGRLRIVIRSLAVLSVVVAWGGLYLYKQSDHYNLSKLSVYAYYDPLECSEKFPVSVTIVNFGTRALNLVNVEITAREVGRSSVLFREKVKSDYIIQPDSVGVNCWSFAQLTAPEFSFSSYDHRRLNWRAEKIVYASFE